MKRLFILCFSLVCCISCTKEFFKQNESTVIMGEGLTLVASVETDSKTHFNDNLQCVWDITDKISVFEGKLSGKEYRITSMSDDGLTANFNTEASGGLIGGTEDAGTPVLFDALVAFYPSSYVKNLALSDDKFQISANISDSQHYSSGSIGPGSFPMAAITDSRLDNFLPFKNVFGCLKLQLKGESFPIRRITLSGNNGEKLSGAAVVTFKKGMLPEVVFGNQAGEFVILDCGDGVMLDASEATSFYIALPPVQFKQGFTLKFRTDNGTIVKKTSAEITINRSKILPVKAFTLVNVEPDEYVDEDGINHGKGIGVDGVIWAPVNCGYRATTADDKGYPFGKLYQWGRKYGNGYRNGSYEDATWATYSSETYYGDVSKEDSDKLYQNVDYPDYYHRWNSGTEASPVKTEADPCPEGWRVPTATELETFNYRSVKANNGNNPRNDVMISGVNLPLAGNSEYNGTYSSRGYVGHYLSSKYDSYVTEDDNESGYRYLSIYKPYGSYYYDFQVEFYEPLEKAASVRCVLDKNDPLFRTKIPYMASSAISPTGMSTYLSGESKYDQETKSGVMVFSGLISEIPERAFSGNMNLMSISLPKSISYIGSYAFGSCSNLETVKLEEGLLTLSADCFAMCNFESLVIPSTVKTMGRLGAKLKVVEFKGVCPAMADNTFTDADAGLRIFVQNSLTTTQYNSFKNSRALSGFKVFKFDKNESLYEISYETVNGSKLNQVPFASNVISHDYGKVVYDMPIYYIPQDAFRSNTLLRTIKLPRSVSSLESDAFNGCTSLKTVTNLDIVDVIKDNTFDSCKLLVLKSLNAKKLYYRAFYQCESITQISLPYIELMDGSVFMGCKNLLSVDFGEFLRSMGSREFAGSGIRTISSAASTKAPTICSDTFYNVPENGMLIHPKAVSSVFASWMTYLSGYGWTDMDHEYVDLGLPSGTLWAKSDAGAYCSYSNASSQIWNADWTIPTKEQWQEMFDNCNTDGTSRLVSKTNGNYIDFSLEYTGYSDFNGYMYKKFYWWAPVGQYNYVYLHSVHEDGDDNDLRISNYYGGSSPSSAYVRLVRR